MTAHAEEIEYRARDREKPLHVRRGLQPAHLALALSRRLVRDLDAIVRIPVPYSGPHGPRKFSDVSIMTALTLRLVFRLAAAPDRGLRRSVLSVILCRARDDAREDTASTTRKRLLASDRRRGR